MATVAEILSQKGTSVISVPREATVFRAIEKMVTHNVGALVVLDGTAVCGLFTERDYLKRIALEGRTSKTTFVADVLSSDLVCVSLGTSLHECMEIMTEQRVRHLPVFEDDQLVGIVSIGDVVKALISEQTAHIQQMTEYIQGRA